MEIKWQTNLQRLEEKINVYSNYSMIGTTISFITKTLLLPVYVIYCILWYIYRTIFIVQFSMNYTCKSFFGNGYGCNILDPNYVFTTVIWQLFKLIIVVHVILKAYELYTSSLKK